MPFPIAPPYALNTAHAQYTNLVACWPLFETSGTSAAEAVTGSDGGTITTTSGTAASFVADGTFGFVLNFPNNASTSLVIHGTAGDYPRFRSLIGDLSCAFWLYLHAVPQDGVILNIGGSTDLESRNYVFYYAVLNSGGNAKLEAFHEYGPGTNVDISSSGNLSATTWVHCAIVRDATAKTYNFYFNATPESAQSYADNPTGGTTATVIIGRDASSTSIPLNGRVCDLRLYDKVLAGSDVTDIYTNGDDLYTPVTAASHLIGGGRTMHSTLTRGGLTG